MGLLILGFLCLVPIHRDCTVSKPRSSRALAGTDRCAKVVRREKHRLFNVQPLVLDIITGSVGVARGEDAHMETLRWSITIL